MSIITVSEGRINWGLDAGGVTCPTDLEDGFYVASDVPGEGMLAGPFEDHNDAYTAMRDLDS